LLANALLKDRTPGHSGTAAADGSGPLATLSVVTGDDCAKDGASATMMDASATHTTMIQATFAGSIT